MSIHYTKISKKSYIKNSNRNNNTDNKIMTTIAVAKTLIIITKP